MPDALSNKSDLSSANFSAGRAPTYEQLLSQDLRWAMNEGSLFFQDRGGVQESLRRICARLDELNIPYAVAGGMALFMHGFRRFTEDVDLLVTQDGLRQIHDELDGRGFVRPFEKSKNLRDTETRVKIEFLVAGQFPGDGKPKPVAFPNPVRVSERRMGISVLNLATLIELKLASGMSGSHRSKDLADVGELISTLRIPREFVLCLNSYVQKQFEELWDIHGLPQRYVLVVSDSRGAEETPEASRLRQMLSDGLQIETAPDRTLEDGYLLLYTTDAKLAEKYGMKREEEFFGTSTATTE